MKSPFILPPHPLAQEAAQEVINRVHNYMSAHPESELHRQGKMFGVLVYANDQRQRPTPMPMPNRLFLHAAEIQFAHPITQKEMHFCIPSGF